MDIHSLASFRRQAQPGSPISKLVSGAASRSCPCALRASLLQLPAVYMVTCKQIQTRNGHKFWERCRRQVPAHARLGTPASE